MTDAQISERVVAGRYRLIEPIGRGGMGTVWRALDDVLRREVAVKEITASAGLTGADRDAFTARTFREARAAGRLSHPGVAAVYDVFEEDGLLWIVLELVPSRTLGSIVRDEGPLPPRRVAEIGAQVLAALRAAHSAGVLHRDVKPENVLIAHDGRAVLTDFGIAALEDDSPMTRTGILIGTPAFMAPERASGATAQRASDLWSLGVTLFHAVEGRTPFERAHPLATLAAVTYEQPDPALLAGPLAPIIHGLLVKDPARRMTAEEAEPLLLAVAALPDPDAAAPDAAGPGPAVSRSAVRAATRRSRRTRARKAREGATRPGPASASPGPQVPAPETQMFRAGSHTTSPTVRIARRASRRRPWIFTVVAGAAIAVVAMAVGGVAYMTARAPEPGAAPAAAPTVTVFTTPPAQPDDNQAAARPMTGAGGPYGNGSAGTDSGNASRAPQMQQAVPQPNSQIGSPSDDRQGWGGGGYADGYQRWRDTGRITGSRR
jgi:eukaryotic-like serine/threonine-protein kinase